MLPRFLPRWSGRGRQSLSQFVSSSVTPTPSFSGVVGSFSLFLKRFGLAEFPFGPVSLVVCRMKSDWPQAVPSSRRRRRRRLSGARVSVSECLRQRRRRRRRRLSFVFRVLVFPTVRQTVSSAES